MCPIPKRPDHFRGQRMNLMMQYKNVFDLANQIGVNNPDVREEQGKLTIKCQTGYQLDADRLWEAIKTHPNWADEVAADITAERTDLHGIYTIESGDTLGKIAQIFLGRASRYPDIFEANRDQLSSPDKIQVGQKLKISKAS